MGEKNTIGLGELRVAYLSMNVLSVQEEKMDRMTFEYMHEVLGKLLITRKPPYPDLTLLITTNGGPFGLEIYDLLNLYPGKITGLVINFARSAGSIILQACDVRLATPNSKILVHHGSTEIQYDDVVDENKTQRLIASLKAREEKLYQVYTSRSGKTREQVQKLCFEDRNLSVDEALEFGLIDGIWTKPFPSNLAEGIKWPEVKE